MNAIEFVKNFHQAVTNKEIDAICDAYMPSPETYVVLEGPRYTTLGYEQIAKGWKDFCKSSISLKSVNWTEGPFSEETSEMAWMAGVLDLTVMVKEKEFTVKFRGTFILTKDSQGNWKIKHEHVSAPLEDPYGIGDWLQK